MKEIGIKFNCHWSKTKPLNIELIRELNIWRDKLYQLGLLGVDKDGIGYGNISIRFQQEFIISGAATGRLKKLTAKHYTRVTDYNLSTNSLTTMGPIKASSESLTHAAIYEQDKNIQAVVHIHHLNLWEKLLNKIPTTSAHVEYGTVAMAMEIKRLFKETDLVNKKILAMAGHREGIISFGKDIQEAGQIFVDLLNKYTL